MKKFNIIDFKSLRDSYLIAKPFSLEDTGITHRELIHWDEKGLLFAKSDINKWRRFNLVELTWIRIISNLRKLNVGLKTLAAIKQQLFNEFSLAELGAKLNKEEIIKEIKEFDKSFEESFLDQQLLKQALEQIKTSVFEITLFNLFLQHQTLSLIISLKLDSEEVEKTEDEIFMTIINFEMLEEQLKIPNYFDPLSKSFISVSLNSILEDVLCKASLIKLSNLFLLTNEEKVVIELIREKKYKSVAVKFNKELRPDYAITIEEKNINPTSRVLDLLSKHAYETLEVKTQDGKIMYFQNTTKIKL